MSGSITGKNFSIATWGESHGKALGVVIDGCPAGIPLSEEDIQRDLDRRKPGQSPFSSPRKEDDRIGILSGVFEGRTTGTPISLILYNTNQRSHDYSGIAEVYRPGHADYTYDRKYGFRDIRGGGRSSGRETAARVAAGSCRSWVSMFSPIRFPSAMWKSAGIVSTGRKETGIFWRCPIRKRRPEQKNCCTKEKMRKIQQAESSNASWRDCLPAWESRFLKNWMLP